MDIASTIALICCLSSPVFLLISVSLGIFLFTERKKAQVEHQKYADAIRELEAKIDMLSENALQSMRDEWLKEIYQATYNSELEVEIKFIYLLMRFLNYEMDDLRTRVAVEVQVGRQRASGIADWVVYKYPGKPFLVIEAKEPNQMLTVAVKEQARSYAYGLSAPFYMLTNGKEIQIYERKVDDDIQVVSLNVKDISQNWAVLEQVIGKNENT